MPVGLKAHCGRCMILVPTKETLLRETEHQERIRVACSQCGFILRTYWRLKGLGRS